jgi:hypothetical protein
MNTIIDFDFDTLLTRIDEMIDEQVDIWELICEAGADQEARADKRRWNQCDLASRVEKQYGEDAIGRWAVQSNIPKRRAAEYRTVGMFYGVSKEQRSLREDFLAQDRHVTITYTHCRYATGTHDLAKAYKALDIAAKHTWSSDQLLYFITRWKHLIELETHPKTDGDVPSAKTKTVFDVLHVNQSGQGKALLALSMEDSDTLRKLTVSQPGCKITLTVEGQPQ